MPEVPPDDQRSNEGTQSHWALAVNPETPAHVLKELAVINLVTDKLDCDKPAVDDSSADRLTAASIRVLERIAEHANADSETLVRLAQHPSPVVRGAVAGNSAAPTQLLVDMSVDESADVRYVIAETPTAPLPVLQRLTEDDNPYVSHRALKTISRVAGNTPVTRMPDRADPRSEQLA